MINEIRAYFKATIKEVDSDLKQHDQYFISSDIPDSKLEDTYFLKIGDFTSTPNDTDYVGSFDVTVEVWKNGRKEVIDILDKAYCNAIEIFSKLQDQKRLDQLTYMKRVVGNSLIPSSADSNDNLGKFTLQFTVTVGYVAE